MPISNLGLVLRPASTAIFIQLADTFLVQNGEGIVGEDLLVLVVLLERWCNRRGEAHEWSGQVVGAEAEEVGLFGDVAAVSAARGISIMVPTMLMQVLRPALPRTSSATWTTNLLLVLKFLDAADQRDHDLGNHLHALLGTCTTASKTARACISVDLGIGDAETAAAVAQHGVELVQFLDALEQAGQHGLEVLHLGAEALIGSGQFPLLLDIGVGAGWRYRPSGPRAWEGIRGAADRGCESPRGSRPWL